jgi:hypothetical protein
LSYSSAVTVTETYTTIDIENVMRRFTADLVMIAQSSGAISENKAREYAHDAELLAKNGYLEQVDVTLFSGAVEVRATRYTVNTASGDLTMSRPGGVLWPRVLDPFLRIVLCHADTYTAAARESTKRKLKINWTRTTADTSHGGLKVTGVRDYASNTWGMQRKDFAS